VNKFYRFTGTAVAAVTLAAAAAAFSAPYAAAQATTNHAAAAPVAAPFPHPMIPARGEAAPTAIGTSTTLQSQNWAGYAVGRSGVKFKKIKATFFVPFLNCAVSPSTFSSHWVGFDGVTSDTVEQDGIEADCNGSTPHYFAWREVFPRPEQPFSMHIHAGDSITASVKFSKSSGKYRMEVRDNTRGTHDTARQRCTGSSCKRSSAEVISEAPTVGGSQSSLADYGAVSYAGISIKGAGHTGGIKSSHWSRIKIEQVGIDSHDVIAIPTALQGRSFDVYWLGEN
jgi:hypothetical protein